MDGSLPEVEYVADFTLTGILENSYLGYATGMVDGIVGNGTAESVISDEYLLYSTDFKTHSKQDFQSIVCDLAADLQEDDRYIQYNWVLLDALGIAYDADEDSSTGAGFSFMTAACILVGVLVLLAAGLVIYNILKISITKRIPVASPCWPGMSFAGIVAPGWRSPPTARLIRARKMLTAL